MKSRIILIAMAALALPACTTLVPKPAQDKIVAGVKDYCKLPIEARRLTRSEINDVLVPADPHDPPTIKVHCPGDPAEACAR